MLDITMPTTRAWLEARKIPVDGDSAQLPLAEREAILNEVLADPAAETVPGGSAHNTARAAQWLLDAVGLTSKTIALGMVGDDEAGRALEAGCVAGGVRPMFQRFNRDTHPANHAGMLDDLDVPAPPTGHCAVLTLPTGERSLVGVAGAHKLFDPTGVCDSGTAQGNAVSKAEIIYVTAFT